MATGKTKLGFARASAPTIPFAKFANSQFANDRERVIAPQSEDVSGCKPGLIELAQPGEDQPDASAPENEPFPDQREPRDGRRAHRMIQEDGCDRQSERQKRNRYEIHSTQTILEALAARGFPGEPAGESRESPALDRA